MQLYFAGVDLRKAIFDWGRIYMKASSKSYIITIHGLSADRCLADKPCFALWLSETNTKTKQSLFVWMKSLYHL